MSYRVDRETKKNLATMLKTLLLSLPRTGVAIRACVSHCRKCR